MKTFELKWPNNHWVRSLDDPSNIHLDIILVYSYARNVVAHDDTYEYTYLPMWWLGT